MVLRRGEEGMILEFKNLHALVRLIFSDKSTASGFQSVDEIRVYLISVPVTLIDERL